MLVFVIPAIQTACRLSNICHFEAAAEKSWHVLILNYLVPKSGAAKTSSPLRAEDKWGCLIYLPPHPGPPPPGERELIESHLSP